MFMRLSGISYEEPNKGFIGNKRISSQRFHAESYQRQLARA